MSRPDMHDMIPKLKIDPDLSWNETFGSGRGLGGYERILHGCSRTKINL